MNYVLIYGLAAALAGTPLVGDALQGAKTESDPQVSTPVPAQPHTKPKQTQPVTKPTATLAQAPGLRPTSPVRPSTPLPSTTRLAKYEPARGAYLGAALDFSKLDGPGDNVTKIAGIMRAYEAEVGRKQAIYTQFIAFPHEDGSFPGWDSHPMDWSPPVEFCNAADQVGATALLTLEPMKPRLFVDGWQPGSPAYEATKKFAQGAGAWGKPLFIRFAHEMNGSWYPWAEWIDKNKNLQRDPGEETGFWPPDYQKAYRNACLLFRQYAPNVALVWCPNSGLLGGARRDVFRPWYPGDDLVDWVALDAYERGWTMPMPGAHLWGGMLERNLSWDEADDPKTTQNESVDFYKTFAVGKNKPMMLCETSATLSYRTDLSTEQRDALSHLWRSGRWNDAEYGWMQTVYGTTNFRAYPLLKPIDRDFPKLKAITWFHISKKETLPVERTFNGKKEIIWFDDAYTDYRFGASPQENGARGFLKDEIALFQRLTDTPYYLTKVQ